MRFATQDSRVAHRDEICGILDRWGENRSVDEICGILRGVGVPCAPVNNIAQIASDEHIARARKMFPTVFQPQAGNIAVTDIPLRFHDTESVAMSAAPEKGEQTAKLLRSILGMNDAEIEKLAADKIIKI